MPDNRYTDYAPDFSSLNELPKAETLEETDQTVSRRAEGRRVRSRRKEKSEAKPEVKQEVKKEPWYVRAKNALTGTTAKALWGIFLGCIGIYLLVAFVSYFVTCVQDQSLVNSEPIGHVLEKANNAGGEGGARISEFLINECLGLGSLVIVVWFVAMSLKMLIGRPRFKSVNFTIKCIIALLTVSLIIGLVTIGAHSQVNWGGYHGRYVNEFIIGFVGWTGAVLLSMFMVAVFVMICLRDLIIWLRAIYLKRKARKQAMAEERAEQEAREAEIRRMQEQEQIDDLRAGEATQLNPEAVAGVKDDDTQVDFSQTDMPLYNIPDEAAEDIEPENEPEKSDSPDMEEVQIGTDVVSDDTESNDQVQDEDETEKSVDSSDAAQDKPAEDKMVVNVSNIGEADKRQLRSQVDVWESTNYKFPPLDLLNQAQVKVSVDEEEQLENKEKIKATLLSFGIPITDIEATIGPTVTLYEIRPDAGVKISKIRGLVDDIALSLAAKGVRIIAPIPGKGTVGIEVANKDPQTVSMRAVIGSQISGKEAEATSSSGIGIYDLTRDIYGGLGRDASFACGRSHRSG